MTKVIKFPNLNNDDLTYIHSEQDGVDTLTIQFPYNEPMVYSFHKVDSYEIGGITVNTVMKDESLHPSYACLGNIKEDGSYEYIVTHVDKDYEVEVHLPDPDGADPHSMFEYMHKWNGNLEEDDNLEYDHHKGCLVQTSCVFPAVMEWLINKEVA